jgi:ABC-type enterochelin transport system ATPase subunit
MYLRTVRLLNTGPIQAFDWSLRFDGDRPIPALLVGRNGTGKSTLISFIVNALIMLKQQVFDDSEVEKGKVYRIRSGLGIHNEATFYLAKLGFNRGVSWTEWQLNQRRDLFSDDLSSVDATWNQIPANETSRLVYVAGELAAPGMLEDITSNHARGIVPRR